MLSKSLVAMAILTRLTAAQTEVHGAGALGTVMGPVAFLWPADRAWDGAHDNTGPCGSNAAIVNRTLFPIGSMGTIETTIAADASKMAIRIAYGNNPTSQTEFQDTQGNVTEMEPGHQCYPIETDANKVTPGSNATIQIEYRGNDSGTEEAFFACADITFVESATFNAADVMCFNVGESEFIPAGSETTTTATTSSTPASTDVASSAGPSVAEAEKSSGGLSGGAKAGIAVGAVVGAALIFGAAFFALRRKRSTPKDTEAQPPMGKVVSSAASIGSAQTAH